MPRFSERQSAKSKEQAEQKHKQAVHEGAKQRAHQKIEDSNREHEARTHAFQGDIELVGSARVTDFSIVR